MAPDQLGDLCAGHASINVTEPESGFPVLTVTTPASRAELALYGGQVLSWMPTSMDRDVLWLSPIAKLDGSGAIRGGIPVCWPWFADFPDPEVAAPAHGYARTAMWQVQAVRDTPHRTEIKLTLPDAAVAGKPDRQATGLGPFQYLQLTLTVSVGTSLQLSLATTNTGDHPATITQALHSYFAIGNIHQATVNGLDGTDYIDKCAQGITISQSGAVHFERETDRIYTAAPNVTLHDPALRRTITVAPSANSNSTVVWNPWIDKARRLPDMPDDGWQEFVCIETANTGNDAATIAPGETRTLRTVITAEPT